MTNEEIKEIELTNVNVGGSTIKASNLWDCFRDSIGCSGMDVAAYVGGGMSVWPCGKTFQKGGMDGFNKDIGDHDCQCDTCKHVRDLLPSEKNTYTL